MNTPLARILLRYGSGFLVSYGLLGQAAADQIATDADIIHITALAIGAVMGAVSELLYARAKKTGGKT